MSAQIPTNVTREQSTLPAPLVVSAVVLSANEAPSNEALAPALASKDADVVVAQGVKGMYCLFVYFMIPVLTSNVCYVFVAASPSSLRATASTLDVEGEAMAVISAPVPSLIVSAPIDSAPVMDRDTSLVAPDLDALSPSFSPALSLAPVDRANSPPHSPTVSSAHQTTPSLADGQSESGLEIDIAPAAGDYFCLRSFVIFD